MTAAFSKKTASGISLHRADILRTNGNCPCQRRTAKNTLKKNALSTFYASPRTRCYWAAKTKASNLAAKIAWTPRIQPHQWPGIGRRKHPLSHRARPPRPEQEPPSTAQTVDANCESWPSRKVLPWPGGRRETKPFTIVVGPSNGETRGVPRLLASDHTVGHRILNQVFRRGVWTAGRSFRKAIFAAGMFRDFPYGSSRRNILLKKQERGRPCTGCFRTPRGERIVAAGGLPGRKSWGHVEKGAVLEGRSRCPVRGKHIAAPATARFESP